jgi:hypothetical protein
MILKIARGVGILAIFLSHAAFALPESLPDCPSANAIRYEGVHMAQPLMYNLFIIYQLSKYDTEKSWLFGVGLITGDSMGEAIASGNRLVQDIAEHPVIAEDKHANPTCVYQIGGGKFTGIAVEADYVNTPQEIQNLFSSAQALHVAR